MLRIAPRLVAALLLAGIVCPVFAADVTDPSQADSDFAIQGEYTGELGQGDDKLKYGVQIIALGDHKFHAVGYPGGLPGDGWILKDKVEADGETKDGVTKFKSDHGSAVAEKGDLLRIFHLDDSEVGVLKKVKRESPTLGEKPPEGAVVLFDGKNADAFTNGKLSPEGWLLQGVTSKQKFQSCKVHLEFLLPYMPAARGQGRANSGCYLQGRYEVQILDSFGLEGKNNECGGIYTIRDPSVNMCFPPLSWQTYDIDFTAAKFENGKKTQDATITVRHNGVEVQKDVKLTHATTAAPVGEGAEPGPLYLQDHGNPVRFRNIWVVEKKD
jgi:hypothetical protein